MLLISIKRLSICKYYFYYEILIGIIMQLLPIERNFGQSLWNEIVRHMFSFILLYFNFWPSLILSLMSLMIANISRIVFFEEQLNGSFFVISTISLILLAVN